LEHVNPVICSFIKAAINYEDN
ncbi:hypothetical protein, partial [Campylobacter fetus]